MRWQTHCSRETLWKYGTRHITSIVNLDFTTLIRMRVKRNSDTKKWLGCWILMSSINIIKRSCFWGQIGTNIRGMIHFNMGMYIWIHNLGHQGIRPRLKGCTLHSNQVILILLISKNNSEVFKPKNDQYL